MLILFALTLVVPLGAGCKKKSKNTAPAPLVSPVGNEKPSMAPVDENTEEGVEEKVSNTGTGSDWRRADEVVAKKKAAEPSPPEVAPLAAKEEGPSEADKRRKALERRVDGTLASRMGALKSCFEAGGEEAGKVSIRFRLHRSGYVMSSTVSGVGVKSAGCARGVLDKMKISGNNVGTIEIVRTLKFEPQTR
ncbi:MAG: hypothetical protein JRH20_07305 [Deltaproteobacteria bacterium]|nr:hypothetical protein [Deltaproteobacteria bacterium]